MVDIKDLLRHSGELETRVEWLEKGLKEIIEQIEHGYDGGDEIENLKQIAQSYLDGEPTTADEFNEAQIQEGEELMKEYGDHER
tara:strand:+ start:965 stop:1216 length:252 start_codon:yes stop_codon:yes gene_type:complete